ncbi:Curved DNA-binding protein [Serratia fonticola]|uniref:Curved DNA-binding protein n=1 Tax=Serratia fonticola TaxID=47917 RepID=A0A4U9W2R6_SERFO|nr:Curved DNA-binding protein [Serratia fonticola]
MRVAASRANRVLPRGQDVEIGVALFLEETLTEQTRTLSYKVPVYNAFGQTEKEIAKNPERENPGGRGRRGAYPRERPRCAGYGRRSQWRFVPDHSAGTASVV